VNFGAVVGNQAQQTGSIKVGSEELLLKERKNLRLVVGDVTSTISCSIVVLKVHIKVAHV
jgi:UDP-N-acetylglucosamine 2-epimerase (non-hydrolysing)